MLDVRVKLMEKGPELDLIEVRYTGQHPDLGALMVNGLKDRYSTTVQDRINDLYNKSHGFFQGLANEKGSEIASLQVQLAQMLAKHPGISPTDPHELDDLLAAANDRVDDLAGRREELKKQITYYQDQLRLLERAPMSNASKPKENGTETVSIPNPRRVELVNAIAQIESEITDATEMKRMTVHHPVVEKLRSRLERLRIEYQSEPEYVEQTRSVEFSPVEAAVVRSNEAERKRLERDVAKTEQQLVQVEQELKDTHSQIAHYRQELIGLPERREAYVALRRKLERAETDFSVWNGHVGALERVITADSKDRGIHFRTVSKAYVPARPFSPTVFGVFLLAAGVGLGLAVAAVFLREMFDRSVRDPNRVHSSLGIPVLEAIGEIKSAPNAGTLMRHVALRGAVVVESLLVIAVGTLMYMSVSQPATYNKILSAVLPLFSS
jgi:uncharacterized protein involved in exopolysaccharide biosynthesis